jgi:N-formylglutamate amidohydrolase
MITLAMLTLLVDDELITIQKGELPIVISAPHGGRRAIPDCPLRIDTSRPQFVTVLDTSSDQLAEETAREVEKALGKKPWLVIARFSRKYVDANRSEQNGTESDAGRAVYRRYHQALEEAVGEVRKQFQHGLLLDFHAQGADSKTVFRGTNNLASVKTTLDHFGDESINGPESFLGKLESQGITIFPPRAQFRDKENKSFNGGFITQTYGATSKRGIDAIQLEFGASFRSKSTLSGTAQKIAIALQSHSARYFVKR